LIQIKCFLTDHLLIDQHKGNLRTANNNALESAW
jgi:hypothetical protein